ncbi:CTD nuclear envelope phosphatase 1 homolog [Drosophila ficusphila]|uniref:CTD nuclear envelope phosphatase 1 homolog n=1 Tax=Drosophila ficusphila TaxID=30025 RepID=UPI0007E82C22|nr:CTD nuclear envelope phosphatase 1 homolog [Drosophila ficusphila]
MTNSDTLVVYFFVVATVGLVISVICVKVPRVRLFAAKLYKIYAEYTPVIYLSEDRLTPVSRRRLALVARKTLVVDMDETLITSWSTRHGRRRRKMPTVPHDFEFYLPETRSVHLVYKRPYVDQFLDHVSKWYDLTVYTAGAECYASPILDFLDRGRGILKKRLYRDNCLDVAGLRAKYVSLVSPNLSSVLLLDDSCVECSFNAGNSVHIKSFRVGKRDQALLDLLPFLDALRFTRDVRSVLQRCTRFDCLTTNLLSVTERRSSSAS